MNKEEFFDRTVLTGDLGSFTEPVRFHKVDETKREVLWDNLVREHHYLGYESMIGGRVKYLITMGKRLLGAISFCSAAYKLGPRDLFIGWDEKTRLKYLPHLLNNNRFLILPWIQIRNLASHVLSLSLKMVRTDWIKQYDAEPYLVETFVDRSKYSGTSYIAANWTYLGVTQGFSRQGKSFVFHGCEKDIYAYVMNRRFKKIFRPDTGRLPNEREELLKMINGIPVHFPKILEKIGVTSLNSEKFAQLLAEHLEPYIPFLGRKEHLSHLIIMIQGRLSDLERKSMEPIALAFKGASEVRNMANFMTKSIFDDNGMLEEHQEELGRLLSHPEGMITGDGCDFPKKRNSSAGVARQYCGPTGKVDSCQASVMVGYASPEGYGLADYALYMPEKWFDAKHAALRKKCRVPENLEFATKNQMLLELISKAVSSGNFKGKYIGVDSSFGRDHDFLDSLPSGFVYFADVPSNHLVFEGRPEMVIPKYSGRGRKPDESPAFAPRKASDIAADPSIPWEEVVLGIGAKGPIIAKDKCLKVVEVRDRKPGNDIWLYVRQLEDGSVKYSLCNESMDAAHMMVRAPALMRWSIEQCFNECKKHLGMDHYEVRIWPAWRRHMLFTLIAHLFIIKLRRMFTAATNSPGPAPVVASPVSADEYRNAIIQAKNSQPINNPNIRAYPEEPQQVLTIGLIKILIEPFMPKVGQAFERINYLLQSAAASFCSHTKKKVAAVIGMAT